METFIANMIIKAAQMSEEAGQEKYRSYFLKTKLYARYQEAVDTILSITSGGDCSFCIVEE